MTPAARAGRAFAWPARVAGLRVRRALPTAAPRVRHPADGLRARSRVHRRRGRLGRLPELHQDVQRLPLRAGVRARPALHERLARLADRAGRHPGAAAARSGQSGLLDVPVPLLHARRAGRRGVRPGLAVHARPVGESRVVLGAPRPRRALCSSSRSPRATCPSSSR